MSPTLTKSSQKKSGAPKAKGAIRAKSGCYTCRIRRKKCDEQKNADGHCKTCVRLRLECLGFGAKRPDFLKESGNVAEMREKIKGFLASQGMIKGHSGSGPRSSEREPVVLRLAEDSSYSSDSSGSPQTPTLTIPDDSHVLTMSNTRNEGREWLRFDQHSAMHHPQDQGLSLTHSTYHPIRYSGDVMLSAMPLTSPSDSIVSSSSTWPQPEIFPSRVSNISPSYNLSLSYLDELSATDNASPTSPTPFYWQTQPRPGEDMINYYMTEVFDLQYLLVDNKIRAMMFTTASADTFARDAMCLLSTTHRKCLTQQHNEVEMKRLTKSVRRILHKQPLTAEDAIAALHTVSTALFIGGRGQWTEWLQVACVFSDSLLRQPPYVFSDSLLQPFQFRSTAEIVSSFDDQLCFILATAMWFDVIASVTLMKPPHFMKEYRELFYPPNLHMAGSSSSSSSYIYSPLRMIEVMGCENHVVWAMAEVSELACWKEVQEQRGCLSTLMLVQKGKNIEQYILPRAGPPRFSHDKDIVRFRTSEIFRASTRLYLYSVLCGDYPQCPDIIEGVEDTINCLKEVPIIDHTPDLKRSVVRSVVLSIFICGCLTKDKEHRSYLRQRLVEQEGENVGNCKAVRTLMEEVWDSRSVPVRWRHALKKECLLLV